MRKTMKRIAAAAMSLIMAGNLWGTSMPMMVYGDVIPGMYAENGDEYAVYTESDAEKVEGKATGSNADEKPVLDPEEDIKESKIETSAGVQNSIALFSGDTIDISTLESGAISIDNENINEWNNKTLTGTQSSDIGQSYKYLFVKGVELNLTIDNLTIEHTSDGTKLGYYSAVRLADGAKLNLTLTGENTLSGLSGGAGIYVPEGCTLSITDASTGSLTVTGGNGFGGAAGIGANACGMNLDSSNSDYTAVKVGSIVIKGGTVTAKGGTYKYQGDKAGAAGIGGSYGASGARIEITGGTVSAKGGSYAAGIGGGCNGSADSVSISGGTVIAERGTGTNQFGTVIANYGAAIGNGYSSNTNVEDVLSCGNITISGGDVTAEGNIGYGNSYNDLYPQSGIVTITGGSVDVNGEIKANSTNIDKDHILHHYMLALLIYGDFNASSTKVTGIVKIGADENSYEDSNVSFTLEDGKAAAEIQLETNLNGEQPITVELNGVTYGEKIVNLGVENEVLWGVQQEFQISEENGCTYTYNNGVLYFTGTGSAEVTMVEGTDITDHQIQIAENAIITLTLKNVKMNAVSKGRSTISVAAGGKLTLVLEGESEMKSSVKEDAVIAAKQGTVVIKGDGSLEINNSCGEKVGRNDYNSGIWAGELEIDENPALTATVEKNGIALRGSKITINGGNIAAKAGNYGRAGIGEGTDVGSAVTINGGTIYAEGGSDDAGGGGISNQYTQAVINGGNVHMNRLRNSNNENTSRFIQPYNSSNELLYCTKIQVGTDDSLSKNARVFFIRIENASGSSYKYDVKNTYTDSEGRLYLWLPESAKVTSVITSNGTYTGSCTVNTERVTNDYENIWGTAKETFAIGGEMFYPVEDIELLSRFTGPGDYELRVKIHPETAAQKTINWSIKDNSSDVAEVDSENNILHIKKTGNFTLEAKIEGGKGGGDPFIKEFPIHVRMVLPSPSAKAEIPYGKTLADAGLLYTDWYWVDSTIIPTVNNNGYQAKYIVPRDENDYTDVEGYDSETDTIIRIIPVIVKKAAPKILIDGLPDEMIVGNKSRTVSAAAEAHNPNNETLKDVPSVKLFYQIGSDPETEFTESGSFVIPEKTAVGTVITVTAKTDSNDNYENGIQKSTIRVIECPHNGQISLKYDADEHWEYCEDCGSEIHRASHSGGNATCIAKAKCSFCGTEYGMFADHKMTKVDEKAATCTNEGNVEYWHCETCNNNFKDANGDTAIQNVVTALLNHDWGAWMSNGDGTHTRTCINDGSHKETETCSGGTATCSAEAICVECGGFYGSKDSGNHVGGTEVREQREATTAADGYTGDIYCLGCGEKLMSGTVIPKKEVRGSSDSSGDDSSSSSSKNSIPKKPKSSTGGSETGTWKKDARGWWYQYPDSSYAKGWRGTNAAGETYQQISWKFINGKWWCFDADGYLAKGWVWDVNGAAWYYIDENEGMKTGWFRERDDSPWYYLDPKTGAMLKDTHVDGYYVDKTGKWDGK